MTEKQPIILTIPDEYHILQTAAFANECPYDGTELTKTGTHHGCYDGEFGVADTFTCEKHCIIQYIDMWRNSKGVRGLGQPVQS